MKRALLSLGLLFSLFVGGPAPSSAARFTNAPVVRLERSQLLQYHRPDGRVAAGKTKKHWQLRRAEILRAMQEVMGPWPGNAPRCPLNLKVEEEIDAGSHWRRLITYSAETGGRTPAYLLVPKGALPKNVRLPAVLALHSTEMSIGHKEVVGLGTPNHFDYGRELAERGFVVLAPAYPLMANHQPDLTALGYASGTMKAIWDNVRGLDLLDALPFVRPGKYGVVGHSLGGHNAIFTAVFDDRLKVIVSSCGFDSFVDYRHSLKDWAHPRYMPDIGRYRAAEVPFDFYELIGALAPRVCFISAPLRDTEFQWQSVDKIAAAARPVFALYGATKNLRVEHPDCAHEFPNELLAKACELLKTNLTFPK